MTHDLPYLASAYLCRPDPLALTNDLSQAIAAGTFPMPDSTVVRMHLNAEVEQAA